MDSHDLHNIRHDIQQEGSHNSSIKYSMISFQSFFFSQYQLLPLDIHKRHDDLRL